ncbi:DUF2442 domain-containing protein [Methylomonas sp. LW13]|uniref:DUF2442 domain-containing protein n=1 Tax=unclassified Methylomonas TaxID=2608980 RepID=UPI00051ABF7F|nr:MULTISPECIES: DUF2442 domain-containing protein [unclassified Methylomonas]NOV30563.1 DUF2442 domain-containing protein [Methylomonas sp. ZR1]PKD38579.1 DUF2442 domain-containing protein [Methylomonas sp. Kb3]QBC28633.1 DUF2442 domain-containing protein [Methylomonas sp. LW13]
MFLHINEAKYLDEYKVAVTFNDGKSGVADLSSALTAGVFKVLQDKTEFAKLRVDEELDTISWPNGLDLAPEFVYFQAFKDDPHLQLQFKAWGYAG